QALVVNHDSESVTDQRCDVETGFGGTDDRNIDCRFAAVDPEVQYPQGHHRVIAFFLCAFESLDKRRRHQLNFGRCHPVKIRAGTDIDSSHLICGGRVQHPHIGAPFVLLGWIPANDKSDTNHMMPSKRLARYSESICNSWRALPPYIFVKS